MMLLRIGKLWNRFKFRIFKKPTLDDLLSKVTDENRPETLYLDKPMGRDIW